MTKAIPAVLVLALVCLCALSSALPSVLNQIVPPQTEPNAPRTLLGKPYRRHRDSQGCPPSCWTLAVADRNDSDANADADPDTLADPDYASAYQALAGNDGWTQTKMNTELRVPLVLNALNSPESVPARLRLMRSKRPLQYSPCPDDAPFSDRVRSDGTTPGDEDAQRVQPLVVSRPKGKIDSRDVSAPVPRSKRLYDRREWKSRLLEEY